jgi:hypothetical protein
MTLAEIKREIEAIISRTPYTKEEVLSFFKAEEELTPDELFAYGIALEYLRGKKDANYKKLEQVFTKKRDALAKRYLKD